MNTEILLKTTRIVALLSALLIAPVLLAVSPAPDGGYPGNNTAEGTSALFSLSSGIDNSGPSVPSALPQYDRQFQHGRKVPGALLPTPPAPRTRPTGVNALALNTTADFNTAQGVNALFYNTTGAQNTATGVLALFPIRPAAPTATGFEALSSNTTGPFNTAMGSGALSRNTTGNQKRRDR